MPPIGATRIKKSDLGVLNAVRAKAGDKPVSAAGLGTK